MLVMKEYKYENWMQMTELLFGDSVTVFGADHWNG